MYYFKNYLEKMHKPLYKQAIQLIQTLTTSQIMQA